MRFAIRGQGLHYLKFAVENLHEAKETGLPHAVKNWASLVDTCQKMGYQIPSRYLPDPKSSSPWQRPYLLHQRRVPPAPPLQRIHVSQLHNVGNKQYLERRLPFVLTGAMDGWKAMAWDLKELSARSHLILVTTTNKFDCTKVCCTERRLC